MDSSKFLSSSTVSYATWSQIDYIITDDSVPIKDRDAVNVRKNIIIV